VNGYLPVISKLKIADPTQPDLPCMSLAAQNGASFVEGSIAPGELITLRGVGFGPTQGLNAPGGSSYPFLLGAVQVLFDGTPGALLYVQSGQINVQVPWELTPGNVTHAQVSYQGQLSNIATFQVATASPAIFMSGQTQSAALNQDGTTNSLATPAKRGTAVAIWGTGLGATNPPGVDGGVTPLSPLESASLPVTAMLGGRPAQVLYVGGAPLMSSGVFQINILIPADLQLPSSPNATLLYVTVNGITSSGTVTIAVQ
jgi:uncharacterized protein (TIGR03437 family)